MYKKKPVSYLFFNRPDCVKVTFPVIKKHKPEKLYLIADGPRNSSDEELCIACRKYVDENINWDCELTKIYNDHNLGLAKRTVSALDQIFQTEEDIIFLEDDNLVDDSFFYFCQELLEKYKYDSNIFHIAGCNFYEKAVPRNYPYSYLFSSRPAAWGFATWKRAWRHMDLSMKNWQKEDKVNFLKPWCYSPKHRQDILNVFDQHCMNNDPWAWSYSWIYSCWANNSLSIIPTRNLVSNIGFGPNATNTFYKQSNFDGFPKKRGSYENINHPKEISRCLEFDKKYYKVEKGSLIRRAKNKIKSIIADFK